MVHSTSSHLLIDKLQDRSTGLEPENEVDSREREDKPSPNHKHCNYY